MGSDGVLTPTVPLDREETGREVIVNIQSAETSKPAKMTQEKWKRFIYTAGSISDPSTPIGPNDLLIASIALANKLTLGTHNTREFSRVPNLQHDDWEV